MNTGREAARTNWRDNSALISVTTDEGHMQKRNKKPSLK
jgi:hypothetical protein